MRALRCVKSPLLSAAEAVMPLLSVSFSMSPNSLATLRILELMDMVTVRLCFSFGGRAGKIEYAGHKIAGWSTIGGESVRAGVRDAVARSFSRSASVPWRGFRWWGGQCSSGKEAPLRGGCDDTASGQKTNEAEKWLRHGESDIVGQSCLLTVI